MLKNFSRSIVIKFENFFDGSFFLERCVKINSQNKFISFFLLRRTESTYPPPQRWLNLEVYITNFCPKLKLFVYIMRNNCFFL